MYMMSGKAISRAICAILLLDAALHYKLIERILPLEQEHSNTEFDGQFWGTVTVYTEAKRLSLEESVNNIWESDFAFCNTRRYYTVVSQHFTYWDSMTSIYLSHQFEQGLRLKSCNHPWMRTLSLIGNFWIRSLLKDTCITPTVYRWCGASQKSIRGYTKRTMTTADMLYRELIILSMNCGQIW